MATLVLYVDRGSGLASTDVEPPVTGREAVLDLARSRGVSDPEDATVNCLLETVRTADDLESDGESATAAVLTGGEGPRASRDRTIAEQLDDLTSDGFYDGVVVVTGSAESERFLPVIESRLPVDWVERVVVRQARDIESTYYLLKQFLADEELRATVLVPTGIVLVILPAIIWFGGPGVALATVSAVIGAALLYKGLGVGEYMRDLPADARDALYSGQVSVVTYVVAGGLALLGTVFGVVGATGLSDAAPIVAVARFGYDAVPWLAGAALAASLGRLLDDVIREEPVRDSSINLPFVAVAVGLVVRGFSGFFLERAARLQSVQTPPIRIGSLAIDSVTIGSGLRLALFILAGVVVSLAGVRAAAETGVIDVETEEPTESGQ